MRIVFGLALLGWPLAWYGPENITAWGYLGLIPFVTGLLGSCPVYMLLGMETASHLGATEQGQRYSARF